jgi:hypothetical protein
MSDDINFENIVGTIVGINSRDTQEKFLENESLDILNIVGEDEYRELEQQLCGSPYDMLREFFTEAQSGGSDDAVFSVESEFDDGNRTLTLETDDNVIGVVSLNLESGFRAVENNHDIDPNHSLPNQVSVQIQPKLEDTDWLKMMGITEDWDIDTVNIRDEEGSLDGDIAGLIAVAYANALDDLFNEYGGLRQKHRRVERDLEAEARGQIRVSEYISRISQGNITSVPCEFSRLTMDNLPNQTLLHALNLAQRLVRDHAHVPDPGLLQQRRRFAAVTHKPIAPAQLQQLRPLPSAFDKYDESGALDLAEYIIENIKLSLDSGQYETIEFTHDMWRLYEEAFARIFANELDVEYKNVAQVSWRFKMGEESFDPENQDSRSSGMQPDIYAKSEYLDCFGNGDTAVVADTKWKTIDNEAIINQDGIQHTPKSADVQQIAAYRDIARERDNNDTVYGVLIYPCTSDSGVTRVQISCDGWDGIYVLGWDVREPRKDGKNVIDSIKNIG